MKPLLILFDIDGTLLTGHGVPRQAAMEVMQRNYPDYAPAKSFHFAGLTDPQIFREILQMHGVTDPTPADVDKLIREFIAVLRTRVTPDDPPHLLPGVETLLRHCAKKADWYLALVTGNVMDGAFIKLTAAGIYEYFVTGAFGDDDHDRNNLPPIAIKRAEKYFGINFDKRNIWVVGDSKKDVECALENNLNCLAVETGLASREELQSAGAGYVVKDLSDTNAIITLFEKLRV